MNRYPLKHTIVLVHFESPTHFMASVFFMAMLPFLLLPRTLFLGANIGASNVNPFFWMADISDIFQQQQELEQLIVLSLYLNVITCLTIIVAVATKDMKKYRITPAYSLLSFLGAGFIVISYIANIYLSFQNNQYHGEGEHQ